MSTLRSRSAEMWGGITAHLSSPDSGYSRHHKPQLLEFLLDSFKGKLTFPLGRVNMKSNLDRFHSQANIISTWLTKSATSLLMHSKRLLQNKIWVETRRKPNTCLQESCRKENQLKPEMSHEERIAYSPWIEKGTENHFLFVLKCNLEIILGLRWWIIVSF